MIASPYFKYYYFNSDCVLPYFNSDNIHVHIMVHTDLFINRLILGSLLLDE